MGNAEGSKYTKFTEITDRVQEKHGKIMVSGRYKRLPNRIEDDYIFPPEKDRTVLGTGYNGEVFLAKHKMDPKLKFAVKAFHLRGVDKAQKELLETEVEIFLSMDHPHVCRLVDVYECDKLLNLVMECMEGGELFQRVVEKKKFNETDAAHATWQMLLALAYLHGKGIVHRDLKLENFLYDKKESDHLKLIDFGFSHIWDPNTTMASSCGTLSYLAPEVLNGKYTSQCDLWSMGVIVFILLVGYMPFAGSEKDQLDRIKKGKYHWKPERWKHVSAGAQEFVTQLLQKDPKERLNTEQALNHPFIKNHQDARSKLSEDHSLATAESLLAYSNASHFRRAALSVMAWSLTNEERAKVRNCFIQMDTTKEGNITLGDLKKVMQSTLQVEDAEIKKIFDALDTSNNEKINYTEFLAAMVSTRIKMHDELLAKTFARFDVDNTGFISKDNLKVVLGDTFHGKTLDEMIESADKSKTGKISYEDFMHYLKNAHTEHETDNVADQLIDKQLAEDAATEQGRGNKTFRCKTLFLGPDQEREMQQQMTKVSEAEDTDAPPPAPDAKKSQCCVIS